MNTNQLRLASRKRILLFCLTFLVLSPPVFSPVPKNLFSTGNLAKFREESNRHRQADIKKLPNQIALRRLDVRRGTQLSYLEELQNFVQEVFTGEMGIVRGVYVPGMFAYPIIQQPNNNDIFVSNKTGLVTQFHQADRLGVTGLLAHNYLSGKDFYNLEIGQVIWIVYGDGELRQYQVASTHQYQKLNPASLSSQFFDLNTNKELTTSEVFHQFYRGTHHLVFQTCLEGAGRLDWGLFFVMALPVEQ